MASVPNSQIRDIEADYKAEAEREQKIRATYEAAQATAGDHAKQPRRSRKETAAAAPAPERAVDKD